MYLGNGFGKLAGYSQVEELGNIETPIVLTNTLNVANTGGLHVSDDSRVVGNSLDTNAQNNIYVIGSDSTIENNLVTDCTNGNGIYFNANGNFYGNNRASGNVTNYNLFGGAQTTDPALPNIAF